MEYDFGEKITIKATYVANGSATFELFEETTPRRLITVDF